MTIKKFDVALTAVLLITAASIYSYYKSSLDQCTKVGIGEFAIFFGSCDVDD